ncbi:MAG: DUF5519 family protein [Cyclobacteriaceae bacterium]|nr:DUF5519 family protein [Cyclobacteriaceae bacterium]
MFNLVVKYAAPLKHVPVLPHLFDALLKISSIFSNKYLLDYLDEIENEVLSWEHVALQMHKFGGTQFNFNGKELGHIHGNGLLDILFSRKTKSELMLKYCVNEHHVFKDSGWISFQVKTEVDKKIAIQLLRYSYLAALKNELAA